MKKTEDEKQKRYDLQSRLIDFAISVIRLIEKLPNTRVGNHIANQLVKSGTSPAANYGEAQGSESRSDFIHKIRIVLKELRETLVWLLIIQRLALIKPAESIGSIIAENNELISIFVSSIGTAQKGKSR